MRFHKAAITSAVLLSSLLAARAAQAECIKVTNLGLFDLHKNSILVKGTTVSMTPLGEPEHTYGFRFVFDVERVWKGLVAKRIEIYQDLSSEQAQFGPGLTSYYLVAELTTPATRRSFGITGDAPAYAPVHCGLEDYSASEVMGIVEALGPGQQPPKAAGRR